LFSRYSILALALIIVVCLASAPSYSSAAAPTDFSSTNQAIAAAFSATYQAEQRGGNVTSLVESLNQALQFVAQAQLVNSTNPAQATQDLQNATQLAQKVSSLAPSVGQAGAQAHQLLVEEISIEIAVVIAASAWIYVYGDRIYHRIWYFLYKDYVVKPKNG
jgi:predicted PurR-regulated permease PerM